MQQVSGTKKQLPISKLDGWLNIDKPPGITSYQVVARLKYLTGQRHIGHAGTLDPAATGVLPIAFGKAARTIEFLHRVSKTYRAIIELGVETDTLDAEGKIVFRHNPSGVSRSDMEATLGQFIGDILQVPPLFSALKINGRPLYELARRGETVEVVPRKVTIYCIELIEFASPLVTIEVECGSGTYIRSLARDVGQTLGVGGHLKSLCRTRYGPFDIMNAVAFAGLQSASDVEASLLPVTAGIGYLPMLTLNEDIARKVANGILPPEFLSQLNCETAYSLYWPNVSLLGLIDIGIAGKYRLKVLESLNNVPGRADS
ncbi:tRNA pseudouridine(55) synthase TruB [Dehalogenimonas sp. 4OHTPN]|uniref:tRNA pseudouridine synthase B n=1 Tax=Dehalogenimonas sp. 4OHTPN TaxID=3166643 RepID=A0AAU8G9K8_9CHLR